MRILYMCTVFVIIALALTLIPAEKRANYGYHLFQHLDHYSGYRLSSHASIYTLCAHGMQFYDFDPNNSRAKLNQTLPHLYLSNRYGAWNLALLYEKNITHILIVGPELSAYFPSRFIYEQLFFRDDGSEAESLKFTSSIPIAVTFITDALRNPANNVLVHCSQGISRSAAVVAAYLISLEEYSMNDDDALIWIRRGRAMVQPNEKFMVKLKQFYLQTGIQRKRYQNENISKVLQEI